MADWHKSRGLSMPKAYAVWAQGLNGFVRIEL